MCYKSPAKVLRSVRRLTRFMESKQDTFSFQTPTLNIFMLALIEINIPPVSKQLSFATLPQVSIPPITKLSNKLSLADLPPDPLPCLYCKLVSPMPNLPRTPSGPEPLCSICTKPVDDRFDPHTCCGQLMHQHCWGDHLCEGWE